MMGETTFAHDRAHRVLSAIALLHRAGEQITNDAIRKLAQPLNEREVRAAIHRLIGEGKLKAKAEPVPFPIRFLYLYEITSRGWDALEKEAVA